MSPLTPDQRDIVERLGENLCVTSGAGCGKTSVLVERYIHFLRQDLTLGLERLAAITFTENAAAEMRRRIRRACQDELAAARAAGHDRAATVWRDRYWDVDIAPIDTIHGFCGGLLRRHAIEAGVDPNFSLLDEAEAALLRQDVVAATVEQLLGADDADLLAVLEHHDLGPARDMLGDVLQEKRELLRRVAAPAMARGDDDILRGLRQAVDEEIVRALRAWIEGTGKGAAVEALRRAKGQPEDKLDQVRTAALAALERLDRAPSAKVAFDAATSLAAGIRTNCGSAKSWPSKEALAEAKAALKTIKDGLKEVLESLAPFDEATEREHLALARAFYGTALKVIAAYEAAKAERSALDFEDLQIRARDLLRSDEAILEECRKRFRAILVDELQDTNFLQFEIVDLLASGAGRPGREPPLRPGALFGVGDPKQSIYRFRGAEFEVFQKALDRVGAAGRRGLADSFRLHGGTAALVNHLFPPLMGNLYEPVEGRHEQANAAVAEWVHVADPAGEGFRADEGHEEEAQRLAARLQEIVRKQAVTVWDAEAKAWRPVRYGDVAILFRRMSYLHLYERALEGRQVPYYVVAGSGFYQQQEVRDVLALARVLDDPSDDLSLAGVLRSPLFALSDEGLYHMRQLGPSLAGAIAAASTADHLDPEDRRGLRRAAALLPEWAAAKDRMGLAALVDRVVFESGYAAAAVGRFGGERAYANLRQMVELARRFERHGLTALGDYIAYVTDFMQSEMRAEQAPVEAPGGDTVRLMTIHKAKGLEFPVVVVPDLSYGPRARAEPWLVHPATGVAIRLRPEEGAERTSSALALARRAAAEADRAEECRLLYVAITRTKDYLVLASHHAKRVLTDRTWFDMLRAGLKVDNLVGDPIISLPTGHVIAIRTQPPDGQASSRTMRRVGPRGVLESGRVAWDSLHDRGQGSPRQAVEAALGRASPVAPAQRPPPRVTATALARYERCPAAYRWTEVLGVEEAEPAAPSLERLSAKAWGLVSHRAMELARSPDEPVVRRAVEGAIREAPAPADGRAEEFRRRLAASVTAFWAGPLGRRVAKARRSYREMPFVMPVGGSEIRGTIDLVFEEADGPWEVVDYKTSAPKAAGAEAHEFQLGLYALAASRWVGRPIERWSVHFLGSGLTAERPVAPADLDGIEARTRAALAGIAAGHFEHSGRRREGCDHCQVKTVCEAYQ